MRTVQDATRQLAAEFLITLCEARDKAPGMMRKLPSFSQSIFQIMLTFLLDIEVGRASVNLYIYSPEISTITTAVFLTSSPTLENKPLQCIISRPSAVWMSLAPFASLFFTTCPPSPPPNQRAQI